MLDILVEPHILVVSDDPGALELIKIWLINENYRVTTAKNGDQAIEIVLAQTFDCIVSDALAPGINGIELCSQLKKNSATKHIPILLASATGAKQRENLLFGSNAGADDYITLPFNQITLLVKVTRLVERSRAEKILRKSENQPRFQTQPQNSFLISLVFDAKGTIVSVNQNEINRFGSDEELIGMLFVDLFHPEDDRQAIVQQIERLSSSQMPGKIERFEARKIDKDAVVLSVSVNLCLLPQTDKANLFFAICEDITERKQTQHLLRKSKARYETVIEKAPVVLFALDKNGIFILSEGAALEKLNLKPGEVLGQSIFDVYAHYESTSRDVNRALAGEAFTAIADLGDFIFETSYTPLLDLNGAAAGTVAVATDITDRVLAERKASNVIAELQATAEREALISRISNAIRESLQVENVFRAVVNELGRHLELDRCHLYLFDETAGLVRSMAQFAASTVMPVSDQGIPYHIADRILPIFRENGYVAIKDVANEASIKELYEQILAPRGVRSIMFVAIRVHEGITGLLSLVTTNYNRDWSQADIALACAVADQAAIAIRQAELYQQAQATWQRETLINQLGTAIRSSLKLSEVLQTATHELGKALSASRSYIRFFHSHTMESNAEYIYTAPLVKAPMPTAVDFTMPIGKYILQKRVTVIFNDVLDLSSEYAEMRDYASMVLARQAVRSAIYCPILVNENFRGALCIEQTETLRRWTENDISLIEAVASQLSLGITHAELFELTRSAKREWEATFDAMSDGIFIFDRDGILQRVNFAGAAMDQTIPSHLVGKHCCQILAIKYEQANSCVVQQVVKTNNRVTVELVSKQFQRPLLITAEPLFDNQNKLSGVVVTARDLYELREAEAVARERQFLLTHILEGMPEPIFAVDETGKLLWYNGATKEAYGLDMTAILKRDFKEMVYPEDDELAEIALKASLKKLPQCFEARYINITGEIRYAVFNSVPLIEDTGINGVLWFIRDITNQKLALQQALQADKLRALGQLASGVAHDFNNVLAAILGRVSLLQRTSHDENVSRNLQVIQTAAEDAAATVRRIQTFARQSVAPDFSHVELGALLRDSLEITRTRWQDEARANNIKYHVELSSTNELFAHGNASELREVFINLIVNALDAMPHGGGLKIRSSQIESAIMLEFTDEGDGITDEVRERIFEPFFSTKGVNGTGLGLSVSYSIIKHHGGSIELEPKTGKGTTFVITLPVDKSSQIQPPASNGLLPVKKDLSILIVDDEDYVREALIEMVSELATNVTGVASGKQALDILQKQHFDVVFTDLSMPEMDGWELAQNIHQKWKATKTVLVTGYGKAVSAGDEKRELVQAIIGKPFSFDQLSQTLEEISA